MREDHPEKKTISYGWIGDISCAKSPCNIVGDVGQCGLLFETRKDAVEAGWNKPERVEIRIRRYKP